MTEILLVDDDRAILTSLSSALKLEGYAVDTAPSGEDALAALKREAPDVILLDVRLPGISGLQVLEKLQQDKDAPPVIMISGEGSIEDAVRAMRIGGFDFLEKPVELEKLFVTITNALRVKQLTEENSRLRRRLGATDRLLGDSEPICRVKEMIERTAPTDFPVLVRGENGTGKELIARSIHQLSARSDGPMVTVNCSSITASLAESELFGHEEGAFTGARRRKGLFEQASAGTIFLDELGDLPAEIQPKLLRVLQEGRIRRVGAEQERAVNVRVIAATNRDLESMVDEGDFREDLFYRLNVIPITAPPLRERPDDIPLLARSFLANAISRTGWKSKELADDALRLLSAQPWPGNVRELQNVVERLVILVSDDLIDEDHVKVHLSGQGRRGADLFEPGVPLKELVERAERHFISRALETNERNMSRTASALGMERSHLYKKMERLGMR